MAKKILVVDDSNAIRQSLQIILEQSGFDVGCATDGENALQMLEGSDFHLIISDVNMPKMDGIEMTKRIRASDKHRFTPILILTSESQADMLEAGKAAGATGWIVKPFDQDALLKTIAKLIG